MPDCEEQASYLGVGPMSRFACDLKPMLKVMAGANASKLNLEEPVSLTSLRYFYQENDGGAQFVSPIDYDIRVALDKVIRHLQVAQKAKPQRVKIAKLKQSFDIWMANMKNEKAIGFDAQLANLEGRINPYVELGKWLIRQSKHSFIGIMTALVDRTGMQYGSPEFYEMVQRKNDLRQEFQDVLGTNGVFIYPVHPTVAPYHGEPLVRAFNFGYTAIINTLGFPATAVPLGLGSEGLPIGLQIVANTNQDRLCLAVAAELERAFGGWAAPKVIA